MSNILALAAIASSATADGTWVDDPFEAIVKNPKMGKPAQGQKRATPSKCSLVDPRDHNVVIGAAAFGANLTQYDEKLVRVSGKGIKASLYSGNVEITLGKDAVIEILGPAPAMHGAPPATSGGGNNPAPVRPKVDPTTYFHQELRRIALLYMHCYQYAMDVDEKLSGGLAENRMDEARFQSLTSSLFITAKDRGLGEKPPALRKTNSNPKVVAVYEAYVPPAPDPAAVEAEKARLAAAEEAKRKAHEAEEAAAKARAAANTPAHPQENLDEDVPF